MKKQKRRFGDRRDGTLIRDINSMHLLMPMLYPNRCDNEAYISVKVDLTNINAWLEKQNAQNPDKDFRYKLFHVITVAMLKTVKLRPKLNRFIANKNIYQRNHIAAAFTVKKVFKDSSDEGLAFLYANDGDNFFTLTDKIKSQIYSCRSEKKDASSAAMDSFSKIPRFILKAVLRFMRFLDRHGKVPKSLIASDPYYSTVLLSNLGSIKLKCGYHHLTNWGTTSIFCVIGEKKLSPYFDENGNVEMRETLELGLTIDERLADGYYYSKSIRLLKKLLENPELLTENIESEIDY